MAHCPNCGKEYNTGDEVCPDCGLVFPFTTDVLAPGTVLQSRYEIQELSHTGGMGYIYLAKDKKLYDRLCIVKQVKEPVKSDVDLKKLEEEARRMAKLSHPNVAMILDHFVENGYYFLLVEHISGKTLSEVFIERHGQLSEEEVVGWAISMCNVVDYIHEEGIIHRDISPDNIMLTKEGSIKFVDFGTLREMRYITTRGTAGMGKYGYTPPEQWQGKPVPQSDIFALGATIYYLLTGNLPLSKEYLSGQGPQKHDFSPDFPPIRTKNHDISPELEAVLQKALQLDVSARYSSAQDFGRELRSLAKVAVFRRKPEEAAKPVLSVNTERIEFAGVRVGSRATRTLTIRNIGTGRLTGKITASHPWLKVTPTTVDLERFKQDILVTVDASYLYGGISADGIINIDTNGGAVNIDVGLSTDATITKPAKETMPKRAGRKKLFLFAIIGAVALVILVLSAITKQMPSQQLPPDTSVGTAIGGSPEKVPRIAFVSERGRWKDIYITNTDGSNQMNLTNSQKGDNCNPRWSPDGNKIAFQSHRYGYPEIYTMDADGTNQINLTNNPAEDETPQWSPDGKRIAFISKRDGNYEIYVMNIDGSNQTRLTSNPTYDGCPEWSPDSKRIAFESSRDGNSEIYVMNSDGSNQTRLTNNAMDDEYPSWSPDGSKIAFIRCQSIYCKICIMNADGSEQKCVVSNASFEDKPVWSPDSKRIAFASNSNGHGPDNITIIDIDTNNLKQLLTWTAYDLSFPRWSPDGKQIAFVAGKSMIIINANADNDKGSNIGSIRATSPGDAPLDWAPKR